MKDCKVDSTPMKDYMLNFTMIEVTKRVEDGDWKIGEKKQIYNP